MISIVIPLYNKRSNIKKTIESILCQEYSDFEVVVCDDGSTDGSSKVIEEIRDSRIQLFRKNNGGPSSARNYGVQKARGEWILFLDADDTLEPGALQHMVDLTNNFPQYNFFCCNHYVCNNGQKYLFSGKYKLGEVVNNFYSWNKGTLMPRAGAALFRKRIIESHPNKEYLRRYEDAENLFEIMRVEKIYRSPVPVMTYNCDSGEASKPRNDISEDFIGHLSLEGKGLWEQYALYRLYIQGKTSYPDQLQNLYTDKDFFKFKFKVLDCLFESRTRARRVMKIPKKILRKIVRKIVGFGCPELKELPDSRYWGFIEDCGRDNIIGQHTLLYSPYHIYSTTVGDYSYVSINSWISLTTIGKFCSIGPNLVCGWGIHPTNGISTAPMFYSTMKPNGMTLSKTNKIEERKPIIIGNDVFIGANVTILDGVKIGDGAVIGSGAVVSKDIPPYAIAVGAPIQILRYRFPQDKIEKLLQIEWWNFDDERLAKVEQYFFEIDKFIADEQIVGHVNI